MPTTKKLATWLWTQLKNEMRLQKAPQVQRQPASQKIQENKILKNGLNGIAMFFLICVGVAILVL